MTPTRISFAEALRWGRLGIVVSALVICTVTIFMLYVEIWGKTRELSHTRADDSFWSLAQANVEILALQSALHYAIDHQPLGLKEVRRRYDVYFSRVEILRNSTQFTAIRQLENVDEDFEGMARFFNETLPLVDGPDKVLAENLEKILEKSEDARAHTRHFSLAGVNAFAESADANRAELSLTVSRLATLTAGQVGVLVLLILALMRMLQAGDRQAREQAIIRDRLEVVVKTAIDAVLVFGEDGRIQDYNGAAERVFGYSRKEIIGKRYWEMIVPDHLQDQLRGDFANFPITGETSFVGKGLQRLELRHKSGRVFPVEFSVDMAKSEGGVIFISYIRDISGRLKAESELVEARDHAVAGEKAKARLLAVMSHEMRTPLNGLLGTLDLIERSEHTDKQQQYLDNMRVSGELLLQHVNDVLDVSRLDADGGDVPTVTFDGSVILDEVIELQRNLSARQGNEIVCNYAPNELRELRGDPRSLRQVLLNLVGNAVKFTRDGTITVETETLPDGQGVEFRVLDTGKGIPERDLARIFDDFVTLDTSYGRLAGGTGLGLGITRRLVEAMGGQMGVESEAGEGSLFWFRLATAKSTQRTPIAKTLQRKAEMPEPIQAGLSVLLVEDNEINRVVARELLELSGCQVTEASSGSDAVSIANSLPFDLILMDISMPGMDGLTATREIRAGDGPNMATRIVALTAHALPEEVEGFHEAGMSTVLIKPISRRSVQACLAGHFLQRVDDPEDKADTLVDHSTLREIFSDLGNARAQELTSAFIAETDVSLENLCFQAEAKGDIRDCAELMHRLAGSSAMFGALALREFLLETEEILLRDSAEIPVQRAAEMREIWINTRAELEAYSHPVAAD